MNNIRTGEISFRLRTWAERVGTRNRKQYDLLTAAADRLDELDERIAIMTEYEYKGDIVFPPTDSELTEEEPINNTDEHVNIIKEPINGVLNNWINNWGKHFGIIPDDSEPAEPAKEGDSD